MRVKFAIVCVLVLITPGLTMAADYDVFTSDMMKPYGLYKKSIALTTKKKNQEKAVGVVQKYINSWKSLAKKYENDVPEKLSQTIDFDRVINRPVAVGNEALAMLRAGKVKKAHEHLEEVRYSLWRMRVDAGIVSLNDKVNDFHEAMEVVLDGMAEDNSSENLRHLADRYGDWLAIKWAEVGSVNSSVKDKAAFALVIADGHKAIAQLINSLKKGDAAASKKSGGNVKTSYKGIFFLPECS